MPLQLALMLTAASVGFVSAIFFCVGSILNTPESILLQATPFFDFSEPIALSLSAEKAQYSVGALLLVVSFILQVLAALVPPTKPSPLPQVLCHWHLIFLVVLLTSAISIPICLAIEQISIQKVKTLSGQRTK